MRLWTKSVLIKERFLVDASASAAAAVTMLPAVRWTELRAKRASDRPRSAEFNARAGDDRETHV